MSEIISKNLAEFCTGLRFQDLPDEIIAEAKRLLLDTIGCGLGGYAVEKGQIAVKYAQQMGGVGEATILGSTTKVPSAVAAFANGDLMNALDWNALLPPSHVPPYVIPPALALAETHGKSGRDLITAVVLALEVSGRVGTSLGGLRATPGGYPLRVWGIGANQIGATAGAAHILELNSEKMHHALGLAAFHAPVPSHVKYNYTKEIGYAKFAPSGWVAQAGVTTACLAEMGYRGDTTFLDWEHGFGPMNGAFDWDPTAILKDIGRHWIFAHPAYKYWPTCGFYQSPLDVFVRLIDQHDLQPEDIDEVTYYIEQFASIPKYLTTEPADHIEAAASGPYVFAVAAHRIKRGPGWQSKELLGDPRIINFMKKVKHAVNPRSEMLRKRDIEEEGRHYLRHRPARVVIKARGQDYIGEVDFANWLSLDEESCRPTNEGLAEKFRLNAENIISDKDTEEAIEHILNLEHIPDVSALMRLLAGSKS